jgi:O-antigen/teichoic acid export membrane protein
MQTQFYLIFGIIVLALAILTTGISISIMIPVIRKKEKWHDVLYEFLIFYVTSAISTWFAVYVCYDGYINQLNK